MNPRNQTDRQNERNQIQRLNERFARVEQSLETIERNQQTQRSKMEEKITRAVIQAVEQALKAAMQSKSNPSFTQKSVSAEPRQNKQQMSENRNNERRSTSNLSSVSSERSNQQYGSRQRLDYPSNRNGNDFNRRESNRSLPTRRYPNEEPFVENDRKNCGNMRNFHNVYSVFEDQTPENRIRKERREVIDNLIEPIESVRSSQVTEIASFIKAAEIVYPMMHTDDEDEYFTQNLKTKISGVESIPTNEIIEARFWTDLRALLAKEYKINNNKILLNARLENFRQNHNETIEEYGMRARKLLNEFEMHHGAEMTGELRDRISYDILMKFSSGLRNKKVKEAVKFRGADMGLAQAVNYAVEQETLHRDEDVDKELICAYCNIRGHRSLICRFKERDLRLSNQAAGHQLNCTCENCGYIGHSQVHCLLRFSTNKASKNNGNVNYNERSRKKSHRRNNRQRDQSQKSNSKNGKKENDNRNNKRNGDKNDGNHPNNFNQRKDFEENYRTNDQSKSSSSNHSNYTDYSEYSDYSGYTDHNSESEVQSDYDSTENSSNEDYSSSDNYSSNDDYNGNESGNGVISNFLAETIDQQEQIREENISQQMQTTDTSSD